MKKPVVIINCSAKKLAAPAMAADLYCDPNSLNHMVNKHLGRAGGDCADILILSAHYGLISARDELAPYESKMPSDDASIEEWVGQHKLKSLAVLHESLDGRDVFVLLTKNYLNAFSKILEGSSVSQRIKSMRVSTDHVGILQLKGRLKRTLLHIKGEPMPEDLSLILGSRLDDEF